MDNLELEDLSYSSEALLARVDLYQELNKINVFVEDLEKEYIYETILKRLFSDQYTFKPLGLGGKPRVIEHFKKFGNKMNNVISIYIVDGDFDRYIYADKMVQDPCFIYLKTYNIESYYLDEKACVQFSKGYLKCLEESANKKVDFNNWKKRIIHESSKLFLCYCYIKKYHPETKTVSRSSFLFIDEKTGFERKEAYENYWNKEVLILGENVQEKINEIDQIYKSINGDDYFNLICGKFYLDSLYSYLKNIFKKSFYKNVFIWHLINNFDVAKLDYVKNAILRVLLDIY